MLWILAFAAFCSKKFQRLYMHSISIIFHLFWACHMLLALIRKLHLMSNNKRIEATVLGKIRMIIYFLSIQDRPDWGHVKRKARSCHYPEDRKCHSSFCQSTPQWLPLDLFLKGFSLSFEDNVKFGLKIDLRCKKIKEVLSSQIQVGLAI